ncbi:MAG: hypothetical protein ACR2KK_11465 [Acidimicrobiales bacterium]
MSTTAGTRSVRRTLGGLVLTAALASCSGIVETPQMAETARIATTVAKAISFPRQESADGLVRAALGTHAGQDSRLTVVEAKELHADKIADPLARLVFRVHLPAQQSDFSSIGPITACYQARFNHYGVIGSPRRVTCPTGAKAIVPAPLAPQPKVVIPAGFDTTLAELLAALPAAPSAEGVKVSVTGGLPAPGVDPSTGLRDMAPTVETAVSGADVGVSLREPPTRGCLLGARIGGEVTVWRLSRVQREPGELSCDPQTGLQRAGLSRPQ